MVIMYTKIPKAIVSKPFFTFPRKKSTIKAPTVQS